MTTPTPDWIDSKPVEPIPLEALAKTKPSWSNQIDLEKVPTAARELLRLVWEDCGDKLATAQNPMILIEYDGGDDSGSINEVRVSSRVRQSAPNAWGYTQVEYIPIKTFSWSESAFSSAIMETANDLIGECFGSWCSDGVRWMGTLILDAVTGRMDKDSILRMTSYDDDENAYQVFHTLLGGEEKS